MDHMTLCGTHSQSGVLACISPNKKVSVKMSVVSITIVYFVKKKKSITIVHEFSLKY